MEYRLMKWKFEWEKIVDGGFGWECEEFMHVFMGISCLWESLSGEWVSKAD